LFAPFQEGGGVPVSLGSYALVEAAGIDVLLNSVRSQAINTAMCTQRGCDLTGKQIVVVQSAQHFEASYAQWARRVLSGTAPGSVTQDLKSLPFRQIKRPKWPL
jgi:microcystin degradation protein MlrC